MFCFELGTPNTTCFVDPSKALLSRATPKTFCGFNEPKQNLTTTKQLQPFDKAAATNQKPQPFSTTLFIFSSLLGRLHGSVQHA